MRKIIILVLAFLVACGDGRLSPQGGTLTGVSAGSGVTGGGTAGNVAVNVGAGSGMLVSADLVSIDEAYTQRRVGATCAAGSSIREIAVDGTVTCEADDLGGGGVGDGDKGDISVTGGGGVWTLDAAVVTFAKQADIATARLVGRVTAGTGVQEALTGTQATTLLDVFTTSLKGLAPSSGGGTTNYLRADGTWAAPPGSGGVSDGDKGDITVSASGATYTIDAAVVTFAKMANLATATFIGRVTAGTGVPEALTGTQATTLLDVFTSGLKGLAPASGGGTTNYLRADGTWVAPPGNGVVSDSDKGDIVVSGTGAVWDVDTGAVGTDELADNLDLSANGSTTVGDVRYKVFAATHGSGTLTDTAITSAGFDATHGIYRITSGSPTSFAGLPATGRGDGSVVCITTVSGSFALLHESGSASATNRILTPSNVTWTNTAGGACLAYDTTATRWRVLNYASTTYPALSTTAAVTVGTTLNALAGVSGSNTSSIRFTTTAQTADLGALDLQNTGTYNTTAASRASYGVKSVNTAIRSTGANDLTNYGIYASASGAQVNYAGWFQGATRVIGAASVDAFGVTNTATAQIADVSGTGITMSGTFDTTSADRSAYGLKVTDTTLRSVAANTLSKYGVYATTAGGTGTSSTSGYFAHTGAGNNLDALGMYASVNGTFDTTATNLYAYGMKVAATATRSVGANTLANIGIDATASGGQTNYGIFATATGGTSFAGWFQGDISVTGNTTLGDAVTDLVSIAGDITVTDVATFNSTVNLGDADTDIVEINGKISIAVSSLGFQDKTPAPTFGACGTSPSATTGGNFAMTVTVGTGTATSCAVNFADTFAASPTCVMSSRTGTRQDAYLSAVSSSAFTISNVAGANMASAVFDIICVGH